MTATTDPTANPEAAIAAATAEAEANRKAQEQADDEGDTVEVRFHRPLSIGGVDYAVGVRKVPRAAMEADAWFVEAHAKEGNITPANETAADGRPTQITRSPARKTTKR